MLALMTSRFTRSSTEPSWTPMRSPAHVHLRRGLARAAAQAHTTLWGKYPDQSAPNTQLRPRHPIRLDVDGATYWSPGPIALSSEE
jgi:hypothetical protein